MTTSYPVSLSPRDALGGACLGDYPQAAYVQWFGTSQEAPLYSEIYRAIQLNDLYRDERLHQKAVKQRSLGQTIGNEARKLWKQWLDRRNN